MRVMSIVVLVVAAVFGCDASACRPTCVRELPAWLSIPLSPPRGFSVHLSQCQSSLRHSSAPDVLAP